jgi:hypothetical protein
MKIDSSLKLAHMQTRSERAGDEPGRGAVTLRLTGTIPATEAALFFATEASYNRLIGGLWNQEGELTSSDAKELALNSEIQGGTAKISDGVGAEHEFGAAKVDSVKVTAIAGRQCEVEMKMHVYPDQDALWFLFTHQQLTIQVQCTAGQKTIQEGIEESEATDGEREQPQDGDLPFDAEEKNPFEGIAVE